MAQRRPQQFHPPTHNQPALQQPPQPRLRPPVSQHNGPRESEYADFGNNDHRASGVGGIGMGFMNGAMDDSDDEDDRRPDPRNKNQALYAAALGQSQPNNAPAPPRPSLQMPAQPQPAAINSPSSHNSPASMHSTAPLLPPGGPGNGPIPRARGPPANLQVNTAQPPPGAPIPRPQAAAMAPPSPGPHPLGAPASPIAPVFARAPADTRKVEFRSGPIMRGDSEETLLARTSEKGNDFWRRFSMVAKEEARKTPESKKSPWLKQYENGRTRLSRWVWLIAIVILLCIGGGIFAGWYFTRGGENDSNLPGTLGPEAGGRNGFDPGQTAAEPEPTSLSPARASALSRQAAATATNSLGRRDDGSDPIELALPTAASVPVRHRAMRREVYGHQ